MPLDTILCLDTSGSMSNRGILELKAATGSFLDGVEETARQAGLKENVAVVEFGNKTRVVHRLTTDYRALRHCAGALTAGGVTPMKEGLMLALKEIAEHGGVVNVNGLKLSPRIVMMTDGRPTDGSGRATEEAIKEVLIVAALFGQHWQEVGLPHPIPIACVGCGDADKKLLEGIAKLTKGMYVMVENMSELSTFFRRQVLLSRFIMQFSTDMAQLRSLLALRSFMRACGEAVEEAEARDLMALLTAMLISAADDDDDDGKIYPDPPSLGTRVRRGSGWKWGNQDGHGVGTVVMGDGSRGWVDVEWDNGTKNSYRYGKDDAFDVRAVNEPRVVNPLEGLKVGVRVTRGNDWKWGNQDGGRGNVGHVIDVSRATGVAKVRWPNGNVNSYRNGAEMAHDLRILPADLSSPPRPIRGRATDNNNCFVQ